MVGDFYLALQLLARLCLLQLAHPFSYCLHLKQRERASNVCSLAQPEAVT